MPRWMYLCQISNLENTKEEMIDEAEAERRLAAVGLEKGRGDNLFELAMFGSPIDVYDGVAKESKFELKPDMYIMTLLKYRVDEQNNIISPPEPTLENLEEVYNLSMLYTLRLHVYDDTFIRELKNKLEESQKRVLYFFLSLPFIVGFTINIMTSFSIHVLFMGLASIAICFGFGKKICFDKTEEKVFKNPDFRRYVLENKGFDKKLDPHSLERRHERPYVT